MKRFRVKSINPPQKKSKQNKKIPTAFKKLLLATCSLSLIIDLLLITNVYLLILCLKMFLNKAMLETFLLGLRLVRILYFLTSIITLQHREGRSLTKQPYIILANPLLVFSGYTDYMDVQYHSKIL